MSGTYCFGHIGESLLARDDNNIVTVLHNAVVLTASEVAKGLTIVDKARIEKRLDKDRNIASHLGGIVALEDVVGQKSADGDGIVALLDGLTLGNVSGDRVKGLVGGCKDGDVAGRGKSLGDVWDKSQELGQG